MAKHRVALTILLAFFLCFRPAKPDGDPPDTDRTVVKYANGSDVVIDTVEKINQSMIFEGAGAGDFEFLRRVAAVETEDGNKSKLTPTDLDMGGIWRVSMTVVVDVEYFTTKMDAGIDIAYNIDQQFDLDWENDIGTNQNELAIPLYSALAVMLRLVSLDKIPVPEDILMQAELWRSALNPDGDVQSFINTSVLLLEKEGILYNILDFVYRTYTFSLYFSFIMSQSSHQLSEMSVAIIR